MSVLTCVLAGAAVVFVRPRYARLDLEVSKASPPPLETLQLVENAPQMAPPPPYNEQDNAVNQNTNSKVLQQNGHSAGGEDAQALGKTGSN